MGVACGSRRGGGLVGVRLIFRDFGQTSSRTWGAFGPPCLAICLTPFCSHFKTFSSVLPLPPLLVIVFTPSPAGHPLARVVRTDFRIPPSTRSRGGGAHDLVCRAPAGNGVFRGGRDERLPPDTGAQDRKRRRRQDSTRVIGTERTYR